MKRLDFYVQHLVRHNASEVVLESGEPVLFRFATGTKRSNTPLQHAQLAQLVEESAPRRALEVLRRAGRTQFEHRAGDGTRVKVSVRTEGAGKWRVEVSPSDGAGSGLEIDRAALEERRGGPGPAAGAPLEIDRSALGSARRRPAPAPGKPAGSAAPRAKRAAAAAPVGGEPRVNALLRRMVAMDASDLHLCVGVPPMVRLHGEIQPLEERPPFSDEELRSMLFEILPARNRPEYEERNDSDFAHTIEGVARFRANYFRDLHGCGAVFRQIPFDILSPEQLGLPPQVLELCYLTKGLVLVTGPTGSGKSTTLATLIDVINQRRADHIITIEDPIEFVHQNKRCLVNQREIGTHTSGFEAALRAALREDPDIVLVGEMRDLETISIAIETAETGHLVFGTLHTTTAPSTVDRVIDQFPADRQAQVRTMLSESLRGVVAQVLCKKIGGGRVAAYEVLIATGAVSNLIREGKTYQLVSVMQTGKNAGMQTMNDHLLAHVEAGRVEAREAYMKSNDKRLFANMLQQKGIRLELD